MQISRVQVIVLVEGLVDHLFYGGICQHALRGLHVVHEIRLAQELPPATGGKPGLLAFHDYLAARNALNIVFQGKRTISLFFLDRDLDGYVGELRRSGDAAYTRYFDVDSDVFWEGQVARAASAAAMLDPAWLAPRFGNEVQWRRNCATHWKEWVKLCVFTQVAGLNCVCNYGVKSQVNKPAHGAMDGPSLAAHRALLEGAAALSIAQFQEAMTRVSDWVELFYAEEEYDVVFKGKWYGQFLVDRVTSLAAGRPFMRNGLEDRIVASLAGTLDFSRSWAAYLTEPTRALARRITPASRLAEVVSACTSFGKRLTTFPAMVWRFMRDHLG